MQQSPHGQPTALSLLLLRDGLPAVTDAEGCFRQAIEVARRQDALS
jgi:hypothetical protein